MGGAGQKKRPTQRGKNMSESLKTLPIGTRVYYTGDMANLPAVGTIVEHKPSARFSDQLRIEWDK
jgi:hypothetical protein